MFTSPVKYLFRQIPQETLWEPTSHWERATRDRRVVGRQTLSFSLCFRRQLTAPPVAFVLQHVVAVTENNGPHRERSVLIPEAAGILGVSRRTVYYRIREGRLQTIRTRGGSQRVLWSSIEALLRSLRPALHDADLEAKHADG